MKKEVVWYVSFMFQGAIVADTQVADVESDDPRAVVWPDRAYAFNMYRREDVLDGCVRFKGEPVRVGPTYYHPDSKLETLREVKKNPLATSTLLWNMKINKWDGVIWSRHGSWPQPAYPGEYEILPKVGS